MSYEDSLEDSRSADKSRTGFTLKKRKGCPVCTREDQTIDYKDPDFLSGFISEGGRMLPSRITGVCSKHQRSLKKVIKLSRIIALLPFVFKNK